MGWGQGQQGSRQGSSSWKGSHETCGRSDSGDPKENSVTHLLNTYLLLRAQCHPVEGQRKGSQSLSSESFPHPDTHCLELNLEGLYNQKEGTYPTWSLEPTEKRHSKPHP